jgi:ABC-2 type transport system ATP-binding protein
VLDHGKIVAEGTADELKRRIPGGHVLLQFSEIRHLEAATRIVRDSSRDGDALALRVPSDGSVRSLKALLDRLDENAVAVESLSTHTPDLDDVFLALTGNPEKVAQP